MGKSMVVYVMGLSVIIAYLFININHSSTSSMDTYSTYYGQSMAHNIALAGANVGTQLLLQNPTYSTNLLNQPFADGKYDMVITRPAGSDSVFISSISRINVSEQEIRDTVDAILKHTSFSKYGYFSDKEIVGYWDPNGNPGPNNGQNVWWITGDSVYGFAHTNGKFNLAGAPYFRDKVTATNAPTLMTYLGLMAPIYASGYQWGITVSRPAANLTNIQTAAQSAGSLIDLNTDVAMTFFADGKVHTRIPPTGPALRNDTLPLSVLAPTGIIAVRNGDVRAKGVYHGKVTVAAFKGSNMNKGNIWIDGDGIVAAIDPKGNPYSPDMLGLVAERVIYLTRDLTRTPASIVNIQAAMYSHVGVFTAEEYWKPGIFGKIILFGSLTQINRGPVGTFSSGGISTGFYKSYRHDSRFLTQAPPVFPVSDKYELVSWWEK